MAIKLNDIKIKSQMKFLLYLNERDAQEQDYSMCVCLCNERIFMEHVSYSRVYEFYFE